MLRKLMSSAMVLPLLGGCAAMQSEFDFAASAAQTATLVMPEPLRLRSLDGAATKLPLMLEYPYQVSIAAGQRSLRFQYGSSWGSGEDSELKRGPVMQLDFNARAGERYSVDFQRPESTDNQDLAEAYFDGFSAWLDDSAGVRLAAEVSAVQQDGWAASLLGGSDPAPSTVQPAVATELAGSEVSAAESVSVEPGGEGRLQSLQAIWGEASAEEKKAFMNWVVAPGQ